MVSAPASYTGCRGFKSHSRNQIVHGIPTGAVSISLAALLNHKMKMSGLINLGHVVQLVRMPACHAGGRGIIPRRDRQPMKHKLVLKVNVEVQ